SQLLLCALRSVREALKQLKAFAEVRNRFRMRRALKSTLARPLPIGNGRRQYTGLCIVMRQQLGLCLAALGKAHLQHVRDALVILLAGTPQQGLIGGVLDQGVLEEVRRVWR